MAASDEPAVNRASTVSAASTATAANESCRTPDASVPVAAIHPDAAVPAAAIHPAAARTGLRRRDFLTLGSVLAAAPFMERVAAAAALAGAPAAAAAAAPPPRPISVGYLEGSDVVQNLRHLAAYLNQEAVNPLTIAPREDVANQMTVAPREDVLVASRRVVPAATLPGGDSSLAGAPVRISIRGFYPPLPEPRPGPLSPAAAGLPRAVDLDIYCPSLELSGGAGFLFHAWSFRLFPAIDLSAPLSFLIAPDWYSDFAAVLSVRPPRTAAAARPRLSRAAFTLGDAQGRPRLQRGAYLLAINPGTWDVPVDLPGNPARAGAGMLSLLLTVSPEGPGR
jgi:hypothetical protein